MALSSQYKSKQMMNTAAQTGFTNESNIAPKKTTQNERPGNTSQNRSLLVRLRNMVQFIKFKTDIT